jgi:hypothetical protein
MVLVLGAIAACFLYRGRRRGNSINGLKRKIKTQKTRNKAGEEKNKIPKDKEQIEGVGWSGQRKTLVRILCWEA